MSGRISENITPVKTTEGLMVPLRIHLPTMKVVGESGSPMVELNNIPEISIPNTVNDVEDKPILKCLQETLPPSDTESEWTPSQIKRKNFNKGKKFGLHTVQQIDSTNENGSSIDMVIDDIMTRKTKTTTNRRKRNSNRATKSLDYNKRRRTVTPNATESQQVGMGNSRKKISPESEDLPWHPPRRGRPKKYHTDDGNNANTRRSRVRVRSTSAAAAMSDALSDNAGQPVSEEPLPPPSHPPLSTVSFLTGIPTNQANPTTSTGPASDSGTGANARDNAENLTPHAFTTSWLQEAINYIRNNRGAFGEVLPSLNSLRLEDLPVQGTYNIGVYIMQVLLPSANPMDEQNPVNRHFMDIIRAYKHMQFDSQREWLRVQEQLSLTQSSAYENLSRLQRCHELSLRGFNSLNPVAPVHYSFSTAAASASNVGNSNSYEQ